MHFIVQRTSKWPLLNKQIHIVFCCTFYYHFFYFDIWLTVHRSSVWIKRPTRCHLVLYLFLLYRLLNMFRATLCPSSGADDLVVFFRCVAEQVLSASQWTDKQPTGSDCLHSHGSATHLKNTTKSSAPEDGHKVARNMLSNL